MTERTDLSALLRDTLPRHAAPPSLHAWVTERAREIGDVPETALQPLARTPVDGNRRVRRGAYAAGLAAALMLGWIGHVVVARSTAQRGAEVEVLDQLFDTHLRSLQVDHLMDVQSTDRHTVKPWFVGKTDIAPRVLDLASSGFPLLGGRLDYLRGRPVPVLVYGRRQHVINLFVWHAATGVGASRVASRDGYHALRWTDGDLTYCAVSDVDPADLAQFRDAYVGGR